jgi:TrmH family RNA methyltransferase
LRYFFSNFVSKIYTNISIIITSNEHSKNSIMLNKTTIRFILSLQKKKTREKEKLFVIEGDKLVNEFLETRTPVRILVAKPEFIKSLSPIYRQNISEIIPSSYDELKRISSLKTPHNALAVIEMPVKKTDHPAAVNELAVALDSVQDPGNLGTIIRAAAWFGIRNIYCSNNSVDVYNPKVIQSGMGALLHVNVFYVDLGKLLESAYKDGIKIYGALMKGKSIYSCRLSDKGIILLGNESKGISADLLPYITDKIMIPGVNKKSPGIDSLNVSMAATVIFSEFTRRKL